MVGDRGNCPKGQDPYRFLNYLANQLNPLDDDRVQDFLSRLEELLQHLPRRVVTWSLRYNQRDLLRFRWQPRELEIEFQELSLWPEIYRYLSFFANSSGDVSKRERSNTLPQLFGRLRPYLRELAEMLYDLNLTLRLFAEQTLVLELGRKASPNMPADYGPSMINFPALSNLLGAIFRSETGA